MPAECLCLNAVPESPHRIHLVMQLHDTTQTKRFRVCLIASAPSTVNAFLRCHLLELSQRYEVTIAMHGEKTDLVEELRGLPFERVRLERRVSPWRDICALLHLWRVFRRARFDLVHSITPKAGLLTALAACLSGVPIRVHWFTGQVWATRRGPMRWLLKAMDCVTSRCTTHILIDSHSQAEFLIREGVVDRGRAEVLADGSVCGVDFNRFKRHAARRAQVRDDLEIPPEVPVALFVGRLNTDKGIPELARAFLDAADRCRHLHLIVVGHDEGGMTELLNQVLAPVIARVHLVGSSPCPEQFMEAADFLVLPSHREGFGSVAIEAAACGIPCIASRVYGLTDAVVAEETGILVSVADIEGLANAIVRLSLEPDTRAAMGTCAFNRARRLFEQAILARALARFYESLLPAVLFAPHSTH